MNINNLMYWCQKVIPLVYSDSLSYYETLCKICEFIKTLISELEKTNNDITELKKFFKELKEYVDNYFTDLDIQDEVNNAIEQLLKNGSLGMYLKRSDYPKYSTENQLLLLNLIRTWLNNNSNLVYGGTDVATRYMYNESGNIVPYPISKEGGKWEIDCSTFVQLLLMGVSYEKSRYNQNENECSYPYNRYLPLTDDTAVWYYTYGGKFPDPPYPGSEGLGYGRWTASQLCLYFDDRGAVFTINDLSELRIGDILFHVTDNPDNPFAYHNINHVSIYLGDSMSDIILAECVNDENPIKLHNMDKNSAHVKSIKYAARVPFSNIGKGLDKQINIKPINKTTITTTSNDGLLKRLFLSEPIRSYNVYKIIINYVANDGDYIYINNNGSMYKPIKTKNFGENSTIFYCIIPSTFNGHKTLELYYHTESIGKEITLNFCEIYRLDSYNIITENNTDVEITPLIKNDFTSYSNMVSYLKSFCSNFDNQPLRVNVFTNGYYMPEEGICGYKDNTLFEIQCNSETSAYIKARIFRNDGEICFYMKKYNNIWSDWLSYSQICSFNTENKTYNTLSELNTWLESFTGKPINVISFCECSGLDMPTGGINGDRGYTQFEIRNFNNVCSEIKAYIATDSGVKTHTRYCWSGTWGEWS